MKLAEALIKRSDMKKHIYQMENRLRQNVMVQDGDEPAEDIDELIIEYEKLNEEYETVIRRINKTNAMTKFDNGSLSDAITKRDLIKSRIGTYRNLYEKSNIAPDRYSRSEIKFVRCIDIKELQNKIDMLSKNYRELDTRIQEKNWTTELI